ncbi:transferase [Streptomyces alboflavus]|uniref:Transferase n=1 Tax=Streptomyces alboflavus TaxID=67267 RepID=A0A1Z1WNB8_9ACTN|nr:transferase [Streptomyces alboflavus]
MIVLPIGERWALIAVLTAVTTPRITFVVLLVGCGLAACYTTAGRVLRSLRKAPRTDRAAQALADLADSGTVAAAFAALRRRPLPLAPLLALVGAAAVVCTAAFSSYGSPWPVLGAAVYAVTRASPSPAAQGAPRLAGSAVLPSRRVRHRSGTGGQSRREREPSAAFGLVAAVAYHHYDTVYRIRGVGAPPRWLVRAIGGHEGRTFASPCWPPC